MRIDDYTEITDELHNPGSQKILDFTFNTPLLPILNNQ